MDAEKSKNAMLGLIDEFIEVLEDAEPVKKGEHAGKYSLDVDELFDILDEIRIAVPKEVKQAQEILENREYENEPDTISNDAQRMIDSAKNRAQQILREAEVKAEELRNRPIDITDKVRDSKEVAEAYKKAEKIKAEVELNAKQMQDFAFEYANTFYTDVLKYLDSYMDIVSENRRELNDPEYAQEKERRQIEEKNKEALRKRLMEEVNINAEQQIENNSECADFVDSKTGQDEDTEDKQIQNAKNPEDDKPEPSEETPVLEEKNNIESADSVPEKADTEKTETSDSSIEKAKKKRGRPKKASPEDLMETLPSFEVEKATKIPEGIVNGSIVTILKYNNSGYIADENSNEYFFDIRDFNEMPDKLELGQKVCFEIENRVDEKRKKDMLCAVRVSFADTEEKA